VSDFIQFEIWDIPGQFKLGDIDAVATFSCTGTLIFIIDSQVNRMCSCILTHKTVTGCCWLDSGKCIKPAKSSASRVHKISLLSNPD